MIPKTFSAILTNTYIHPCMASPLKHAHPHRPCAQAIASLAASFARVRQRSLGVGAAAAAAANAAGLHRFTPSQLANLLWALSSLRVRDRALLVGAGSALARCAAQTTGRKLKLCA